MPKGKIDVIPEVYPNVEAWLPRGIQVISATQYGGAMRLEIQGDEIEDGVDYQIVVTEEPMRRVIELKKSGPNV